MRRLAANPRAASVLLGLTAVFGLLAFEYTFQRSGGLHHVLPVGALGRTVAFQAVLAARGGSAAAVATSHAGPLADAALIALVVWAAAVTAWRPGRTWGVVAAGLPGFSVSACLYQYQTAVGS